jgi:hypothetical protein
VEFSEAALRPDAKIAKPAKIFCILRGLVYKICKNGANEAENLKKDERPVNL